MALPFSRGCDVNNYYFLQIMASIGLWNEYKISVVSTHCVLYKFKDLKCSLYNYEFRKLQQNDGMNYFKKSKHQISYGNCVLLLYDKIQSLLTWKQWGKQILYETFFFKD